MKLNKGLIFTGFLVIIIFTPVPDASGEQYNFYTLRYFNQSIECLITGDYDGAIENCNQVIRRDPNSSVAYTIRARAYYEKGNTNNAISDCTQAIRFDRNNISAYSIRANAYIKNGDFTRAIADWEAVLRINPESADARYNIELAQQARLSAQ